jgi:hypothetical protein
MKRSLKVIGLAGILTLTSATLDRPAFADFWGGDDVILGEILTNAFDQLTQLEQILGTGQDNIEFLRQINQGINQAMMIQRTANQTLHPGLFGQYRGTGQILSLIHEVYGRSPSTPNSRVEQMTDQSVAEAVALHNDAFSYADQVDPEAERIKSYSRDTSPIGAARLTAESVGVLIHVNNQILRTNAANLQVTSENLALMNRREKINSDQFKMQYEGLSSALLQSPSFSESSNLDP